jgi:biopolymer transport protein ExbD
MKIKKPSEGATKAELQMTSLIDVVFLLLIFFVTTFKIAAQEGDFNVKMPLANSGGGPPPDPTDLPVKLRLKADANGNLSEIVLNEVQSFETDWDKLRAHVIELIGSSSPNPEEGPEVEIDIDYNLRYEHVIQAITAVTGRKQGNDIIRLIDRIKFAPPRKPS